MARYQAAHGDKFVTAVVMMLEDEDAGPQVSFEPFQVDRAPGPPHPAPCILPPNP